MDRHSENEMYMKDLRRALEGKVGSDKLDAIAASLQGAGDGAKMEGNAVGFLFWVRVKVNSFIDYPRSFYFFQGDAGGIFGLGGADFKGDLYLTGVGNLLDVTNFSVTFTPFYTKIMFFDASHTLVASAHGGSISTLAGTGGGQGQWIKVLLPSVP